MRSLALAGLASFALARGASAQEALLLEVDARQKAYELADMSAHRLTGLVGVGYPELPLVGADYLLTAGTSLTAQVGAFLLLPSASAHLTVFLVDDLGFRPYVAPGALAYLRPDAGDLGLCPALRVGFENRGVGGDWFRAEIGAAYNLGPLALPVIPIVAVARGFSPVP